MNKEDKKYRVLWVVTCILTLISIAMMYLTHEMVPFMMDDLWYSTKLSSDAPITGFRDIIESQIWHYLNWGGRSMTHGILQLTLLAGENAADVLNVVMTIFLCGTICLTAETKKMPAFFAAMGMILGLNANWKMSMFWQAGAANYLYITGFILLFLHCYLREILSSDKKLHGITLWIVPLGLLAGWSNENMGPAVWLTSLIVMFLLRKEHGRIKPWMVLGNLSCLFGSIMVIAAPGNFVRSAQVPENEYGFLWRCFLHGYGESKAALEYLFPTLLLLAGVLLLGKCVMKLTVGKKNVLLLICALLSWGAMALSPHYPDRATFGTMVLLICVILSMAHDILRERRDLFGVFTGVAILIWLRGMFFLGEYLAICWGWIR